MNSQLFSFAVLSAIGCCRGKQVVKDLRGCRVCRLDGVGIYFRGGGCVNVTEPVRDCRYWNVLRDLQRGVCVAQAVDRDPGQIVLFAKLAERT